MLMSPFIIFIVGASVPLQLYDEVLNEITSYDSKYNYLDITKTCMVEVNPLTFVYEFEGYVGERISLCAQRPWRTVTWRVEQCDIMCSEFKVSDHAIT